MVTKQAIVVMALYHFVELDELNVIREHFKRLMVRYRIKGTLILAGEGINGTVAGIKSSIDSLLGDLLADSRFSGMNYKFSYTSQMPFLRTSVKLKKEIVTIGLPTVSPNASRGIYVEPKDWNALISQSDVVVIDTRNDYEVEIGSFKNALNPNTTTFREFPEFVKQHLDPSVHRKIAMYCTGGIRCEKSTALLNDLGFEQVFHLKGGILKYLEEVPQSESLWDGECFVFDQRVSVNHDLAPGEYDQCYACRLPITEEDKQHPWYKPGIHCHRCYEKTDAKQKAAFNERQKQVVLAQARGEPHIGSDLNTIIGLRKADKRKRRSAD